MGYQIAWIEVYQKNEYANKYPMILNVDVTKKIVVAANKITREQIITDGSVKLEHCEIKTNMESYYMKPDDIIGLQSKHVIQPGTPILVSMVRKLPAIERGDHVTIKVIVDNLLISSKGIAKNDGQIGDEIRVRSDITGKEMVGLTGLNKEVYVVPQGMNHASIP
ncbi:MAG: flagellar basal body P-ring formation protein FlgA [Simkaniaceae bacterium]|nr:flagellar basal body P-ring formation protein FlgA [Simkaniaceae bacterium]